MTDTRPFDPDTLAVRAGTRRSEFNEHSEALFLTSSFVFGSAAEAASLFSGEEEGFVYSRFSNPTVRMFEERLAALEGAEDAVATSSGMAAILATALALLKAGDHVVCGAGVFGATVRLFSDVLGRFGIDTTYVRGAAEADWRAAITPSTRLLSATKYLDGQGRVLGGAVLGRRTMIREAVLPVLRSAGPSLSPFNAWVLLKGLETLPLRMRAQSAAAQRLAEWLETQPGVQRVHFPGLASHPQRTLVARQQGGPGAVLSFELGATSPEEARVRAWRLIDHVRLMSITANLGDTRTTITHPASTTHGRLTPEARARAGIGEGLIRLAVGLESVDDLKTDLARALAT